jgi:hypothetical protein
VESTERGSRVWRRFYTNQETRPRDGQPDGPACHDTYSNEHCDGDRKSISRLVRGLGVRHAVEPDQLLSVSGPARAKRFGVQWQDSRRLLVATGAGSFDSAERR